MRHRIFLGYVALMVLVFLIPVPSTPLADSTHVDKLVHFGIFLGFALLLQVDRAPKVRWTLVISFAFAAAIELAQSALPYRQGDGWDLVAGALGATVGILVMLVVQRLSRPGRAG